MPSEMSSDSSASEPSLDEVLEVVWEEALDLGVDEDTAATVVAAAASRLHDQSSESAGSS